MSRLFSTAVSSMSAAALGIDVIGNNVANVNTNGFKSSSPAFATLFSQTLREARSPGTTGGQDAMQVGTGVNLAAVNTDFTQGSLAETGNNLDMAIEGRGYFVVKDPAGEQLFTRNGQFSVDATGKLVQTTSGLAVQGLVPSADGSFAPTATAQDIIIPPGLSLNAKATGNLSLAGNLSSGAAVGDTSQVQTTYYDSLGTAHSATVVFTKTAANAWSFSANTGTPAVSLGTGTLSFDTSGKLTASTGTALSVPAAGVAAGATSPQTITLDTSVMTQVSNASLVQATNQDGMAPGSLTDIRTNSSGDVQAVFSNGQSQTLARVALATFTNDGGLKQAGGTLFTPSTNSGTAQIGSAGAGGAGKLVSQSLESSNVDLASQLTSLIVLQRGYQASTRLVSTADEMMQDALRLKS